MRNVEKKVKEQDA
jgi:hypothetical protein